MLPFKIKKPILVIDTDRAQKNIEMALNICRKRGLEFRPHFKTHRSETIGNFFSQSGVHKITVSSVAMAKYFAIRGFWDITIAFPANMLELEDIDKLAGEINLNLLFDSIETVDYFAKNMTNKIGAFIETDDGYHRTGVDVDDYSLIRQIADRIISSGFDFRGILTHSGRTYSAGSPEMIRKIFSESMFKLLKIKQALINDFGSCILSIGDTPSFILADDFNGVDEVRPGVFIFFDAMMESFGVCDFNNIALTVATPVIGKYPDRMEIALYAGAVHLSKDSIKDRNGLSIFGYISRYRYDGTLEIPEKDNFLRMISQEHGIASVTPEFFNKISIGDVVAIVPVHACLTSDAAGKAIDKSGREIRMMEEK